MDPLSIVAGTTGTLAFTLQSANLLYNLVKSIKDAPAEVELVKHDVEALNKTLTVLQGWIDLDIIKPEAFESLFDSVSSCLRSLNQLESLIKPLTRSQPGGSRKWKSSLTWTFKQSQIKDLRERLSHAKHTLNIAIGISHVYATETGNRELKDQIEAGNDALRSQIDGVNARILQRETLRLQLASIQPDAGSLFNGTDGGFPLRRFLDELPEPDHPWAVTSQAGDILSVRSFSMVGEESRSPSPTQTVIDGFKAEKLSEEDQLSHAIRQNDFRKALELLSTELSPNAADSEGFSPLHRCAANNNSVMAEFLLFKGSDMDRLDSHGKTPLQTSIEYLSPQVTLVLIFAGTGFHIKIFANFLIDLACSDRTEKLAQTGFAKACLEGLKQRRFERTMRVLEDELAHGPQSIAYRRSMAELGVDLRRSLSPIRRSDLGTYEEGNKLVVEAEQGDMFAVTYAKDKTDEESAEIIEKTRLELTRNISGKDIRLKHEFQEQTQGGKKAMGKEIKSLVDQSPTRTLATSTESSQTTVDPQTLSPMDASHDSSDKPNENYDASDGDVPEYSCKGCGETFQEGKAFELAGNRWHIGCFRCDVCGSLLDDNANLLLLGDGSLVCNNCTYSCSACSKKIEDFAILTGDQAFCGQCFKCRSCKKSIENLRYARTSQGIFCMDCHDALTARRCKKTALEAQSPVPPVPPIPQQVPGVLPQHSSLPPGTLFTQLPAFDFELPLRSGGLQNLAASTNKET